jgi:hypothetical protein
MGACGGTHGESGRALSGQVRRDGWNHAGEPGADARRRRAGHLWPHRSRGACGRARWCRARCGRWSRTGPGAVRRRPAHRTWKGRRWKGRRRMRRGPGHHAGYRRDEADPAPQGGPSRPGRLSRLGCRSRRGGPSRRGTHSRAMRCLPGRYRLHRCWLCQRQVSRNRHRWTAMYRERAHHAGAHRHAGLHPARKNRSRSLHQEMRHASASRAW